ncbi:Superfamily II DNA and RNA helicase [Desulfonispora thiosulfatigenes DSM 11270]|uniref:Superfamily II DNA and RNA helicase n=1 Tax=Desulfonispora thiosulfatigenes DSM 11270 TaxID=656914 RepID=A0A1W1UD81_DESTI|nr:DEAD/DEAH box helicase [Desulfonispora thiosulfatigenes]SMB78744.1 Superfamily II DNA and RNA helicase [Desulfonispora thiosulfatigenes DSM 11270]
MDKTFEEIGVDQNIIKGLKLQEIEKPTKIQEEVIPEALLNEDIIGEAQTGSGKTLAYLIPIFQKIDAEKRDNQVIILAPTHELAIQVNNQIRLLVDNSDLNITSAVIIGNVNIKRQIEVLKNEKPHIIVGSAVRILELIKLKKIKPHTVKTIVIDEADKLLDKNNLNDIKAVIKTTLKDRQIMLFSATIPEKTLTVSKEIMKDFKLIKINPKSIVNENITHMYFVCERRDKLLTLRKLVHALNPKRAIAFINNAYNIEMSVANLEYHGLKLESIYGDVGKEERKKALNNFSSGKTNLLLASDIAARGLDIKDIDYIFSLDIPEDPHVYLHRAGRTARAGATGISISIITEKELFLLKSYERAYKIKIEEKDMYKGNIVDKKINKKK